MWSSWRIFERFRSFRALIATELLTQAIIKAYNDGFVGQADKEPAFAQELLKVARTNLDEKGVAAFQEVFAKGYLPQAEDNEGTKRQAPECCSPQSTNKS